MSKSNGTTKIATFYGWVFEDESGWWVGENITQENTGNCVGIATSCGAACGTNTFTNVTFGDKVILRKGGGRSWGEFPWTVTGLA